MSGRGVVVAVAFSRDNLRRMEDTLSPAGIDLCSMDCLQDALWNTLEARLVLYDTDGPEHWRRALEQLLRRWPGTRVVLISRLADERMWIDALEAGAHDLLMKPFRPVAILGVLRSSLTPSLNPIGGMTPPTEVLATASREM